MTPYLTVEEADLLAEKLPGMRDWAHADPTEKEQALLQAAIDVDSAMRYQGRKLDANQEREFPRVDAGMLSNWDFEYAAAEVPEDVLIAVVHQANSILAGDREERLDARHDGVASQSADGLAEAYSGEAPVLCRKAHDLMKRYWLRSGPML